VNIACEGRRIHTNTSSTGDPIRAGRPRRSGTWFTHARTSLARVFGDAAHLEPSGNAPTLEQCVSQMPLLGGSGLTQGWMLELLEQQTFVGRSVIRVRAMWQPGAASFGHWPYIHHYDLLVDLAYGIVLRCAARAENSEVAVLAVRAVEFDKPIDDAVFSYDPSLTRR
jgi:hypothetical protein